MTRIAIVTGGIGGLGTEICRQLALAGRQVIAADLPARAERVEAFQAELADLDGAIRFEPVDVSDFASCNELIQRVEAAHGSVDVLVNAAGITRDTTLRKMDPQQWHELMRVNLDGVFNMCRNVVEGMSARGFGRIVNLSSVNGQTGQFGQTNYAAAKAGMHGFTMALAQELANKGVTVNTVSPGYIGTEMVRAIKPEVLEKIVAQIPVKRLGTPEEIGSIVSWLACGDSGFTTGADFSCNGGLHMG